MKIGLVWQATNNSKSVKAALPYGGNFDVGKLVELLKAADKPGSSKAQSIGDPANEDFTYTPAWLAMNRDTVEKYLRDTPNAQETHRRVLDALAQGVGGQPLIQQYAGILDAVQPSLLEGFFAGMPEVKRSQMRAGFTAFYKTNRNKCKTLTNLYKILENGSRPGSLPDITK